MQTFMLCSCSGYKQSSPQVLQGTPYTACHLALSSRGTSQAMRNKCARNARWGGNQKAYTWHDALVNIFHDGFPRLPLLWCFLGKLFMQIARLQGKEAVTGSFMTACTPCHTGSFVSITGWFLAVTKSTQQVFNVQARSIFAHGVWQASSASLTETGTHTSTGARTGKSSTRA